MAKIVNLRSAKKTADRAKKRLQGAENAAKFGRTKAARDQEKTQADTARAFLDGHKRDADKRDADKRGGDAPPE